MGVTQREKQQAIRQRQDVGRYERLGVNLASRIGLRFVSRVLHAYRRGDAQGMFNAMKEFDKARPFLREAILVSHLLGLRRALIQSSLILQSETDRAVEQLVRRLRMPVSQLRALAEQADAQALTVLAQAKASVERKMQESILESTRKGLHIDEGVRALREAFDASGITPTNSFQLEAIFRTQTQLAYGAGKWQANQREEIQEILWGYKYVTVGDERVRPTHQLLEGVTLPKDDSFWLTSWPPNGWACRCQAIEIFEERDVVEVPEPQEVEGRLITPGPDKGFAYNPGIIFGG